MTNERRRFLRARKFDLAKAKIMWCDTQEWKKSFKVDELYETFEYKEKAEVDKLYPRCVSTCLRVLEELVLMGDATG